MAGTDRPRMLLDCDPGHDDALAIVAAAHHGEILAITAVSGNIGVDRAATNARIVCDLAGVEVPVHRGAAAPLVVGAEHAEDLMGESGLGGVDLPEPSRGPDGDDATEAIVESCRSHEGLWLVPTGPLTNVALALRAAPDVVNRVAGISLMGGGTYGNRTAAAEFNIWADPHAAAEVFGSGAPIVMAGLDVTHRFCATPERIAEVEGIGGVLASTLGALLRFYARGYAETYEGLAGAAMHDVLAVLAVTHPDLFVRERRHVAVETAGEMTRGMTVIDRRPLRAPAPANADVLTDLDDTGAWGALVEAIRARTARPAG